MVGYIISIFTYFSHIVLSQSAVVAAVISDLYLMSMILLLTLLARLHFTFKASIYEISTFTKRMFGIVCILLMMILIFFFIIIIRADSDAWNNYNPHRWGTIFIITITFNAIYCASMVIAIIIFGIKLMKLTDLRAPSIHPELAEDKPEIKLTQGQIKMIENATKYVSLLFLGIFSTQLLASVYIICSHIFEVDNDLLFIMTSLDSSINVICAYLQFSVSTSYYHKYCKYLHLCWRYLLTKKATFHLEKRYKQAIKNLESANADVEESQSLKI